MTNYHKRSNLAAAYCSIAALLFLLVNAAPVRAQSTEEVLRPWNCLMSSGAAGSIFKPVPPAGCVVPAVAWSGIAPARAINPPGTPSALTATVTGQTVVLTWARPASGGTAASYIVQAGTASGLANLASADTESALTTLTATDVPNGTYFFRVLARSASGTTSATSNEILVSVGASVRANSFGTAAVCTVPPASTGLTAIQNGNIAVTFVWVAGEGACQAFALPTGYVLEYGFAPGQTAGTLTLPAQPTNVTVSLIGVGSGVYYIRVKGVNASGAAPASNEVTLIVGGGVCNSAPAAPASLSGTVGGGTVVLAWNEVSPAQNTPTGYKVIAGVAPGGNVAQFGVTGTVFRINGVPAGTYYFRADGVNACGTSADSNEIALTVGGPSVPVVVTGVHPFAGSPNDGANFSTLTPSIDGNFIGTTVSGGPLNPKCVANLDGCGTLFKMTPAGAMTILYAFGSGAASSPVYPYSRPYVAADGSIFGTTTGQENGTGAAVIYKRTPDGTMTFLAELGGPSYSALTPGGDGFLYGTTTVNGPGPCSWRSTSCLPTAGLGTIFKISPSGGVVTYLHTFTGPDGSQPYGGLLSTPDGTLIGTTSAGGTANLGTIYRISSAGAFTILHSFTGGADGANPAYSALIRASDGTFWGTTQFGGGAANAGTVYTMTAAGAVTVVHAFTGIILHTGDAPPTTAMDGLQPGAGLLQASDGNLYGAAGGGGSFGGGTTFVVTPAGVYTQLYAFAGSAEGGSPTTTLIVGPDGNLWGTTQYGGTFNRGVVFKMTLPR